MGAGDQENQIGKLLEQLGVEEKNEPLGWFRWMHCEFLRRMGGFSGYSNHSVCSSDDSWLKIESWVGQSGAPLDRGAIAVLERLAERDAWRLGQSKALKVAEVVWKGVSPLGRGKFVAGLLEAEAKVLQNFRSSEEEELVGAQDWVLARLDGEATIEFDALSGTQAACVAVLCENFELFEQILGSVAEWGGDRVVRLEPNGGRSKNDGRRRLAP